MAPSSHRVDFPDGNWWELLPYLPWEVEMEREFIFARSLPGDAESYAEAAAQLPSETALRLEYEIETMTLIKCSVAWSLDGEITEQTIRAKPGKYIRAVLTEMRPLWMELGEDKKKAFLSLASKSSPFQWALRRLGLSTTS